MFKYLLSFLMSGLFLFQSAYAGDLLPYIDFADQELYQELIDMLAETSQQEIAQQQQELKALQAQVNACTSIEAAQGGQLMELHHGYCWRLLFTDAAVQACAKEHGAVLLSQGEQAITHACEQAFAHAEKEGQEQLSVAMWDAICRIVTHYAVDNTYITDAPSEELASCAQWFILSAATITLGFEQSVCPCLSCAFPCLLSVSYLSRPAMIEGLERATQWLEARGEYTLAYQQMFATLKAALKA